MEAIMHRSFMLAQVVLALIGLLLVAPQKASADQIFACKDNTSGILFMYATAPAAGCGPGRTLLTLSFGPGSALGASEFKCGLGGVPIPLTEAGQLFGNLNGYTAGTTFGSSGVTYAPGGASFLLQPGIYLLQLSVADVDIAVTGVKSAFFNVAVVVNGGLLQVITNFQQSGLVLNGETMFSLTRNVLFQITAANTAISFVVEFSSNSTASHSGCDIIFTRQQ
jgi:hypothetical protein